MRANALRKLNMSSVQKIRHSHSNLYKMDEYREIIVKNILYELWFSVAESIFKRVCEVTELDFEQIEALKAVALRPNDFQIEIE